MFIELTEYLRCPSGHGDEYLVLTPDHMQMRNVTRGTIGCPVCHRDFAVENGVAKFGVAPVPTPGQILPDPKVLPALLSLQGSGGYVALVGSAATLADELAECLPEVHLVLVNSGLSGSDARVSYVENDMGIPLRSGVLRGIVVGAEYSARWAAEAVRTVPRGRRVVLLGDPGPLVAELQLLAAEDGVTVAEKV